MNPWLIGIPGAAALGGATTAFSAIHPASQIFGPTIRGTASPSELALTFDDGPNPSITPRLLDLLDRYQVKATLFVIGRFVRQCPDLTREIAARGHLLGNHTETHPNLFWLGRGAIAEELRRCQEAVQDATGSAPAYFRPPFGYRNPWVVSAARELGMRTVMWTLLPRDWKAPSAEWLTRRLQPIADHAERRAQSGAGDVLCLHDGAHAALGGDRRNTLTALESCLPRWSEQGLKFVTIGEAAQFTAR